jgi:four helix bundle protein
MPIASSLRVRWRTNLRERALNCGSDALDLVPALSRFGPEQRKIADELFRAASSIGAHLEESQVAASRRDMGAKQAIALREARESLFWLRLLVKGRILPNRTEPLAAEANELVAMLTTSVKKLRHAKGKKEDGQR